MFPQQGDGDRTGNAPAGTTIDRGLGHPVENDYYQLTHGGLLGTSRPAHYSVRGYLLVLSLTFLFNSCWASIGHLRCKFSRSFISNNCDSNARSVFFFRITTSREFDLVQIFLISSFNYPHLGLTLCRVCPSLSPTFTPGPRDLFPFQHRFIVRQLYSFTQVDYMNPFFFFCNRC